MPQDPADPLESPETGLSALTSLAAGERPDFGSASVEPAPVSPPRSRSWRFLTPTGARARGVAVDVLV